MFSFKSKAVEDQFDNLHPELKTILEELGHWSASAKIPMPVVTCLVRTPEENRAIYNGVDRFSWHLAKPDGTICAMDLRVVHYTDDSRAKVLKWILERCPDAKKWEVIYKPHGTGPHYHIAIRDRS